MTVSAVESIVAQAAIKSVRSGKSFQRVVSVVTCQMIIVLRSPNALDGMIQVSISLAPGANPRGEVHRDPCLGPLIRCGVDPLAAMQQVGTEPPHQDVIMVSAIQPV